MSVFDSFAVKYKIKCDLVMVRLTVKYVGSSICIFP